jgi:solute carrier family 35 protein E3
MAFNFFSSIGIIFTNKIIFKSFGFKFATFYTALHFAGTAIGLRVCRACGVYEHKKMNHMKILPMSLAFCLHIVFNNLSLQYNSVGFYQLMKVLMSPLTALVQTFAFGVPIATSLQLALGVTCCGVGIATVNDMNVNALGTFYAVLGLLGGVFYQLFVKTKQKALGGNSFQVLEYQAPQSALLVLLVTPVFDQVQGPDGLLETLKNANVHLLVALSLACVVAFCVNLSLFMVIGKTSPLSYQVLGHGKLVFVLLGGIIFFGGDTNPKRLFGMFLTFCGVVWYGHLKLTQASSQENWDKGSKVTATDETAEEVPMVQK